MEDWTIVVLLGFAFGIYVVRQWSEVSRMRILSSFATSLAHDSLALYTETMRWGPTKGDEKNRHAKRDVEEVKP